MFTRRTLLITRIKIFIVIYIYIAWKSVEILNDVMQNYVNWNDNDKLHDMQSTYNYM